MGTYLLEFLGRVAPSVGFDSARARSPIKSMSNAELFRHGRKCVEAGWRAGQNRPLTMSEISEIRLTREEYRKRRDSPQIRA